MTEVALGPTVYPVTLHAETRLAMGSLIYSTVLVHVRNVVLAHFNSLAGISLRW